MLNLNRRPNEAIYFIDGGEIVGEVRIVSMTKGQAKLGLDFVGKVQILRDDLMMRKGAEYIQMIADWEDGKNGYADNGTGDF